MQKSEAYKALAFHQFDKGALSVNDLNVWLFENDPVTLCKALGIYTKKKKNKNSTNWTTYLSMTNDKVYALHSALFSDSYGQSIKEFRTLTGCGLKEANYVMDVYVGKTDWSTLNEYERSLYNLFLHRSKNDYMKCGEAITLAQSGE